MSSANRSATLSSCTAASSAPIWASISRPRKTAVCMHSCKATARCWTGSRCRTSSTLINDRPSKSGLRAHLLHQRVGDFEIGVDVLHVVAFVQRFDQPEQFLAGFIVDRDGALRFP